MEWQLSASGLSRRAMLGATAALAAGPALAEECRLGPAPHEKGARVFMDMDQQELDASYNQLAYEPLLTQITTRLASNSEAMRARSAHRSANLTGRPRLRGSTSIERSGTTRRFSFSSTAARGLAAQRRITAFRPRCSSMPGRITSRSISSRSRRPAAILA
jgi:hypothetical protein